MVRITLMNETKKSDLRYDIGNVKDALGSFVKTKNGFHYIEHSNKEVIKDSKQHTATGFFNTILKAYNNEYGFETSPDDWLQVVGIIVGKTLENHGEEFRKYFVDHEGKEKLIVVTGGENDYRYFINSIGDTLKKKIKQPDLCDALKCDFSTSTEIDKAISSIVIAQSMSTYFDYLMSCCGIKFIDMKGTEEDWESLVQKFGTLKKVLGPILPKLPGYAEWFDHLEKIFQKLLETYQAGIGKGKVDIEWWQHILTIERRNGSGPNTIYNGWIFDFYKVQTQREITDLNAVSIGISRVNFKQKYPNGTIVPRTLLGGTIGVEIDKKNEIVKPVKVLAVCGEEDVFYKENEIEYVFDDY